MLLKAVIFDLDGTLLDTAQDIAASMNYALQECQLKCYPLEDYKRMVGNGLYELIDRALPDPKKREAYFDKCVLMFREHYRKNWASHTLPYTGIHELLDELAKIHIPLGVLSNKNHEFTGMMVDHYFGAGRFISVYGAREGIAKKPDPGTAWQIAKELKVQPGDCMFVGDTDTDMLTATAAGMTGVGVLWGFRDQVELLGAGAKVLIRKPLELLPLLQ